jgi:alpha-N-arabinofuranosidase
MNWNRTVLKTAGANIDYLAIHHYYGRGEAAGDPLNLMARPLFFERFYAQVEQLRRELVPQKSIKLAINEWGLDLPVERQYSMESALYGARLMNVFERSGDVVGMSAVSDLVNGWPGGIIQANRHGVFVSPVYLVNQLYSESLGVERLSAEVSGPTFDSSKEGRSVPYLDAVASRSADGKLIFIKVVNTDAARPLAVAISVQGAGVAPQGEVATVAGSSPAAWNDFSTPEAVSIGRSRISAGRAFAIELPKNSVSVITLTVTP